MRTLAILTLLAACTPVEERWAAWVDAHNACETSDDCVEIFTDCPLGCSAAVNVAFEQQAQDRSDAAVRRYQRFGRACMYDCIQTGPPVCSSEGRCEVTFIEP